MRVGQTQVIIQHLNGWCASAVFNQLGKFPDAFKPGIDLDDMLVDIGSITLPAGNQPLSGQRSQRGANGGTADIQFSWKGILLKAGVDRRHIRAA